MPTQKRDPRFDSALEPPVPHVSPTPAPRPKPLYGGANIDFSQIEGMEDLEPKKRRR